MDLDIVSNNQVKSTMTKEEEECLKKVYDMIEDDIKMKPLRKLSMDRIVLMTIRSYNYEAETVFRILKSIQTCTTELYPEIFTRADPDKLKHVLDKQIVQIVKNTKEDCPGVLVIRIKRWKTNEASADEIIAAGMIYLYNMAKDSLSIQKNGVIVVIDTEGFGFSHARQASYDLIKKLTYCMNNASPIRIIRYIAINSHMLFEKAYQVVKFVIPEKDRENIFVVKKDLTPLHDKFTAKELLPVCLGGEVPDAMGFVEDIEKQAYEDRTLPSLISQMLDSCEAKKS